MKGWLELCLQYLTSLTMVSELFRPLMIQMENGIEQAILTVWYVFTQADLNQRFSVHFLYLKVVFDTLYKIGPPAGRISYL